jgi:hypothetical protein
LHEWKKKWDTYFLQKMEDLWREFSCSK